jgi:hypothetical protein
MACVVCELAGCHGECVAPLKNRRSEVLAAAERRHSLSPGDTLPDYDDGDDDIALYQGDELDGEDDDTRALKRAT